MPYDINDVLGPKHIETAGTPAEPDRTEQRVKIELTVAGQKVAAQQSDAQLKSNDALSVVGEVDVTVTGVPPMQVPVSAVATVFDVVIPGKPGTPAVEENRPECAKGPAPIRFPAGGKNFPPRCDPYTQGTPNDDNGDYWSDSGQVAYTPDGSIPDDPGLGQIAGFAYYRGTFSCYPRWDINSKPNPDPSTRQPALTSAYGGPIGRTLKQVRAVATTGNDCFVMTETGFIYNASTQTGHGSSLHPSIKIPAQYQVTDMALTSNNELLLVSCYDTVNGRGYLAVIMVEGKGVATHTFQVMGLHNQASVTDLKLLGYVEVPLTKPSKVSAACNGHWSGPSDTVMAAKPAQTDPLSGVVTPATPQKSYTLGQMNLEDPTIRKLLSEGGAWSGIIATRGYAVVISRDENKAVIVDLSPVFKYIRDSWFGTLDDYKANKAARGPGDNQWPQVFTVNPAMVPLVKDVIPVTRPVSVICGHKTDRWSLDIYKFHIGLEAGELVAFDASSIMARSSWEKASPTIKELGRNYVGKNPCSLAFARDDVGEGNPIFGDTRHKGDGLNNAIYVTCRQDRKIVLVVTFKEKLAVLTTFEDKLLKDPVDCVRCVRGPHLLVADYEGKQIVGFRTNGLKDARLKPPVTYPLTDGAPYELTGVLPIPGKPFCVTSENVN